VRGARGQHPNGAIAAPLADLASPPEACNVSVARTVTVLTSHALLTNRSALVLQAAARGTLAIGVLAVRRLAAAEEQK
jgi:hypothetical protein